MRALSGIVLLAAMCASFGILSGCAALSGKTAMSGVDARLDPADYGVLADAVAALVQTRLPPAGSTISLAKSAGSMDEAISRALRTSGYAVEDVAAPDGSAHSVKYSISKLDTNIVVLLYLDGSPIARSYGRDQDGKLVPVSCVIGRGVS